MKLIQKIAVSGLRIYFKVLTAVSPKLAAKKAFDVFCTAKRSPVGKVDAIFEKATLISFQWRDYLIKGYQWNKGAGRRVLIVHGFESTVQNFAAYVQPLLDKGYEVLAFDAPAHGISSGKRINVLIYRDFLHELNKRFELIESAIAHSLGGLALSLMVSELPENKNWRLVLLAPLTESTTTIRLFSDYLQLNNEKVRAGLEQLIFDLTRHNTNWFSITRCIEHIQAPILWVHDRKDQITPFIDAEKVIAKNYSNVKFVITEAYGHSGLYRKPDIIKLATDFA